MQSMRACDETLWNIYIYIYIYTHTLACNCELNYNYYSKGRTLLIRALVASSYGLRSQTSLIFWYCTDVSLHTWSYEFLEICLFGK
jgi:hypothetical protein